MPNVRSCKPFARSTFGDTRRSGFLKVAKLVYLRLLLTCCVAGLRDHQIMQSFHRPTSCAFAYTHPRNQRLQLEQTTAEANVGGENPGISEATVLQAFHTLTGLAFIAYTQP